MVAELGVDSKGLGHDVFVELAFGFGSPWGFPVQYLIKDAPYGPDVAFRCIVFAFQHFLGHIKWGANSAFINDFSVGIGLGKPEIANF